MYPPEIWRGLLYQGYALKSIDSKDPRGEFLLYKLSEEEQLAKLEKLPRPKESNYFKNGEQVTSFAATDIDGKKIDLNALKGKIVVLNFWFVNCAPCRMEMGDLNKLVDSFKTNDDIVFAAVGLDDKSTINSFLQHTPFHYRIIDNGRWISDKFGIGAFPTHVILDPDGKVYFHTSGLAPQTVYWLKKSINELVGKKKSLNEA